MAKKKKDRLFKIGQRRQRARQWNSRLNSNERRYRRMTFGRYTGWFICHVPDDYIIWAIKNIEDQALAGWFADEYHYRYPKILKK